MARLSAFLALDVGRWTLDVFSLNTPLVELIRETIRTHGPQSFAWFMQQALHHPEHGYYSSGECTIGRHGDYFTNVSVGPLFGQLLAAQFTEIWERLGRIDNFVIVEQGAHHGEFACDVLASLHKSRPDFFAVLRYRIVEPFPVLQDRQSQTLAEFEGKIEWRNSIDTLESFTGVHFSNELLDSMPVHLIVSRETKTRSTSWNERFVALNGDELVFVDQATSDQKLQENLKKLPAQPSGFQTEVNLAMLGWVDSLARKVERGYVLAIDYGHPREEFYASQRSAGTLQVRAKHRLLPSPLVEVGHADITAHVEWTNIAERAEARGFQVTGFTDQHHFITGILSELLRDELSENVAPKTRRALQTLLHPEMLGRNFQVLALEKEAAAEHFAVLAPLAGFKFAREPRSVLGLGRPNPS